ncbi:hypothetical protein V6N13_014304 [Hibiscus sabdariffa]
MEEEAWKLFLEKVGRDILNILGVEPIARSIAKRFVGLPLGVITIASCMKGIDDICEWRNSLKELSLCQKSVNGFEDEMFQQLQFSYDRLKDPELQHCFLGCVLYPEDEEIGEGSLIQLWIAKGLVEEMDSMQAEFDRGRAFLEIYGCRNMRKLFSLNCVPLNLQELRVNVCEQVEEIIASEGGMVTMEFRLPQLKKLILEDLPELNRICSVGGVLVCDS